MILLKVTALLLACGFSVSVVGHAGNAAGNAGQTMQASYYSEDELAEALSERVAENGVGLVVGVVDQNGTAVISAGHSGDAGIELNGDTVFQIGSVTKGITGLLLAEMVVRGEVGLDDPVQNYLPDGVQLQRHGRPITLRDLSRHTSGLPSLPANMDMHAEPDPIEAYTVDDLYSFLSTYEPMYAPGERAIYSNLGVALLGRVLGDHLGLSYEEALLRRVLMPLGMSDTAIALNADQVSRLAVGHDRYRVPVRTMEMRTLQASGSLRSTANDLLKMMAAYNGLLDTPLSEAMELQIQERLGWGIRSDGTASHSGGKAGFRSAVVFDREAQRGVVVLSNARTYDRPMDIARSLLAGEQMSPAPPAPPRRERIIVTSEGFSHLAGRYETADGDVYEVAISEPELLIRYPNSAIYQFAAETEASFYFHGGNDDVEFLFGPEGAVTEMRVYGDGREFETYDVAFAASQ